MSGEEIDVTLVEERRRGKLLQGWQKTHPGGGEIFYSLCEEDAQERALAILGRLLTDKEMYRVGKSIGRGIGDCWVEFMDSAIEWARQIESK